MRIAFLVHRFPQLSQTFILNQITGLRDGGHEIDVFASEPGTGSKVHADVHRYRLLERTRYWKMPRGYLLRGVKAAGLVIEGSWRCPDTLIRTLGMARDGRQPLSLDLLSTAVAFRRQKPYDVVHCQFGTLGRTAVALCDIGAVCGKLIVSFRGSDLTASKRDYREIFRKGDLFLPVCKTFEEELIEQGCDSRKIRVHHSGIKVSRFACTARHRVGNEPVKILTIARLVEKKGVAYAIRAMARLKSTGRRVLYTVAGEGPLRTELERMVGELGLQREVHLVGSKSQEEVIDLLRGAHLLVAPSVTAGSGEQEGIPNALKEAMATGIPVVSTRHSGIPELVENGVSGLLVEERDSDALAGALAHLVDHPETWFPMGRAGRARVEAEFNSDRLNEELVQLYQHVLGFSR